MAAAQAVQPHGGLMAQDHLRQQRMHHGRHHQPGLAHDDAGRQAKLRGMDAQHVGEQGHVGPHHVVLPQFHQVLHTAPLRRQQAQRGHHGGPLQQPRVQPAHQPLRKGPRAGLDGRHGRLLPLGGRQGAVEQGLEDHVLAGEMRIQPPLGQAAAAADVIHRGGGEAAFGKLHQGRIQDLRNAHLWRQAPPRRWIGGSAGRLDRKSVV